jgi:acyl carrier protein
MRDTLKTFIDEEILTNVDDGGIGVEDELLMSGLVDSIGVMRLVAFVEETFDVEVPPEDVTLESFQSIATIADYVSSRKASDA